MCDGGSTGIKKVRACVPHLGAPGQWNSQWATGSYSGGEGHPVKRMWMRFREFLGGSSSWTGCFVIVSTTRIKGLKFKAEVSTLIRHRVWYQRRRLTVISQEVHLKPGKMSEAEGRVRVPSFLHLHLGESRYV